MKKVALVTGARKGLGLAWCEELVSEGYVVYLTARSITLAKEATDSMKGEVYAVSLDVMDEYSIQQAAETVRAAHGRLDLLINNAGVNPKDLSDKQKMESSFYLDKLEPDVVLSTLHANSISPMMVTKHFRELLRQSNRPLVINISSWLGSVSTTKMSVHYAYCGSKNLLNMFTKIAANDLKEDGIIAVSVNPGWVQTDMGGVKGEFTPRESVRNILTNVVSKATLENSGSFFNYDGEFHPW